MPERSVTITVNGTRHTDTVPVRQLLVHYVRETLGLTGTHIGCDTSQCGACTVSVDGAAVKSCTMLTVQADGAAVTTIEGLAADGSQHPLQEGFWEEHGLQCGFNDHTDSTAGADRSAGETAGGPPAAPRPGAVRGRYHSPTHRHRGFRTQSLRPRPHPQCRYHGGPGHARSGGGVHRRRPAGQGGRGALRLGAAQHEDAAPSGDRGRQGPLQGRHRRGGGGGGPLQRR